MQRSKFPAPTWLSGRNPNLLKSTWSVPPVLPWPSARTLALPEPFWLSPPIPPWSLQKTSWIVMMAVLCFLLVSCHVHILFFVFLLGDARWCPFRGGVVSGISFVVTDTTKQECQGSVCLVSFSFMSCFVLGSLCLHMACHVFPCAMCSPVDCLAPPILLSDY